MDGAGALAGEQLEPNTRIINVTRTNAMWTIRFCFNVFIGDLLTLFDLIYGRRFRVLQRIFQN